MKKLEKAISIAVAGIAVCSVVAGVLDRIEQKKRERKAKSEGRKIHKPYGPYEKYIKRQLDFFLSSVAVLVLSPVIFVTAWLVRVKLGRPVLFIQERPGRDGKIFHILKFRTMSNARDENGELLPDGQRLPKFGEILRKTSMDELPELLNIIKGDMSMVGPRPLLVRYLPRYNERQKHRHDVRPGLTGLAQVSGRNRITWEDKLEDDVQYIEKITFLRDAKILIKTMAVIFKHDEVSIDIPEFIGVEEEK